MGDLIFVFYSLSVLFLIVYLVSLCCLMCCFFFFLMFGAKVPRVPRVPRVPLNLILFAAHTVFDFHHDIVPPLICVVSVHHVCLIGGISHPAWISWKEQCNVS